MEGGRLQDSMNEVKVCNICGDAGFDNCLALCSQCKKGAEHTYCMRTIYDVIPKDWVCEGCTLKQKTSLYHEPEFGGACKKRILSRVLSSPLPNSACKDSGLLQTSSLKRSCDGSSEEQLGNAIRSSKSQEQLKVSTTLTEKLPTNTYQHLTSKAYCSETGNMVFTSKDDSKECSRTELPLSTKTVDNSLNLQSGVKPGVIAPVGSFVSRKTDGKLPNLQSEINPGLSSPNINNKAKLATMMNGASPIAQGEESKMAGLELSLTPCKVKPLPVEPEHRESSKPAGITSSIKGNLGQPVGVKRDSAKGTENVGTGAACKPPLIIAGPPMEGVGLVGVSKNLGVLVETSSSTPQHSCFNEAAFNSGIQKRDAKRSSPIITEKYDVVIEPFVNISNSPNKKFAGEVSFSSDARGHFVLSGGKDTAFGQVVEKAVKGVDGSTISCEVEKGPLTKDGSSTKDIATGQETKGTDGSAMTLNMWRKIEKGLLTRAGNCMTENAVEPVIKDSCKTVKARGESISSVCSIQPPPGTQKVLDKDATQEGPTGSTSCTRDISMSACLSEGVSVSRIPILSVSEREENVESLDPSKCRTGKESSYATVPRQELEFQKRTSGVGLNKITRVLLKRLTKGYSPPLKCRPLKLGKSAVSACKEVTSNAGHELTSPRNNKQGNKGRFLTQVKKVRKRECSIVPSKAPASLNVANCLSSTSTQPLPAEGTSFSPSSILKKDNEPAGRISQTKDEASQSSKEERGLTLLHQTRPVDKKHCCDDKGQKCDATTCVSHLLEKAPRINASNVTRGQSISVMRTTTALHSKGASDGTISNESGNVSLPLSSKLLVEAETAFESTKGLSEPLGPRAGGDLEDASINYTTKEQVLESLPLSNAISLNGGLISASNGEHVEAVQHHLLEQKGGSEAIIPLPARVQRSSSHIYLPGGIGKDVGDKSTRSWQAGQNNRDRNFSSDVYLSPPKCALAAHFVNRFLPRAAGDDQPVNCVSGIKEPPWKKVCVSLDDGDGSKRYTHQSLSVTRKDLRKDCFHPRHQIENRGLSDHKENPSILRSKHSPLAGSNFDFKAMKRNDHSCKGVCKCHKCEAGYSTDFSNTKSKDELTEWRENDSQDFLDRGLAERRLDSVHVNGPLCDSASLKGSYSCDRFNEVGYSTEFCEGRSMVKQRDCRRESHDLNDQKEWKDSPDYDKQRDWRKKDTPEILHKQQEWRSNEIDDSIEKPRGWRRKDLPELIHKGKKWRSNASAGLTEKQRDWRRKDSPELMHKQKEWRGYESAILTEKPRHWRRKDAPNLSEKERDWRRKESSVSFEKQRRQYTRNNSLSFHDGDLSENLFEARHEKRSFSGFRDFDVREQLRSDPRKEKTLNSRSFLESSPADFVHVGLKRSIQCTQLDEDHTLQWQSREEAGIERESLGLECLHPSKAIKLDMQPVSEAPKYTRVHPRQIVRAQVQDTCMASQLHGPTRNYFVQESQGFPSSQKLWTGCFNVTAKNRFSTCYNEIQAHPSIVADPKVCKAMLALPKELHLQEINRWEGVDLWPRAFQQCPPTRQSIGIYFAPKDLESDDRWYQPLVHHLNAGRLFLISDLESMQLLVFPSQLLPETEQRWDGRYFMWGIFRGKKSKRATEEMRPLSERDLISELGSPEGNGEVIDMEIDMVGGRDAVSREWQDCLPPGFLPPPPPLP